MRNSIVFFIIAWVGQLAVLPNESVVWAKSTLIRSGDHVPGEIVIQLRRPQGSYQAMTSFYVSAYSKLLRELETSLERNSILEIRPTQMDLGTQVLRLREDQLLSHVIERILQDPAVEFAEPNWIYQSLDDGLPDDPDFKKTWNLHNVGQIVENGEPGSVGSDIQIVPLWQKGIRGSRKILVGVIDSGMDWDHPDLKDNIYTHPGEIAGDGKDNDGNGLIDDIHGWNFGDNNNNTRDDSGHGTHCAGVIGAVGNNGIGVAGVNWEVSLLPIKFITSSGRGSMSHAVDSIRYAIQMKVSVLSNSWGSNSESKILMAAIQEAKDAGIVFVAGAGNSAADNAQQPWYPASYPIENIISVAATDSHDQLATFSNYGATTVHVAAPGVKILSTHLNGTYRALSGTSMATPHIAGIAALLMSADSKKMDSAEIKRRLIETSDPVSALATKVISRGRVNASNAYFGIIPKSRP